MHAEDSASQQYVEENDGFSRTELPSGHWWVLALSLMLGENIVFVVTAWPGLARLQVRLDGPLMGRPALAPACGALALALCA